MVEKEKLDLRIRFDHPPKWKLRSVVDGKIRLLDEILWAVWEPNGSLDEFYYHIDVGRCPLLTPYNETMKCLLKPIQKIGYEKEDYMEFTTEDGEYELIKVRNWDG